MINAGKCPFCKTDRLFKDFSTKYFGRHPFGYAVFCQNCHAMGPAKITTKEAVDAWKKSFNWDDYVVKVTIDDS